MGDVIFVQFGDRPKLTRKAYFEGAARCREVAEASDDPEVRRIFFEADERYMEQGRQRF